MYNAKNIISGDSVNLKKVNIISSEYPFSKWMFIEISIWSDFYKFFISN